MNSATTSPPTPSSRRNRSTRALWDTNYVDQSWINSIIKLIPRMRDWVATYYPGTKIGITEYNWGAENHINGATAQADILGIFGREGLDMATRWTTPDASTPTFKAMKMYRNYDGNKSTFGDTSVFAGGPNPDNIATFAALAFHRRRADDHGHQQATRRRNAPVNITLTNFLPARHGPSLATHLGERHHAPERHHLRATSSATRCRRRASRCL